MTLCYRVVQLPEEVNRMFMYYQPGKTYIRASPVKVKRWHLCLRVKDSKQGKN